MAVDWFRSADWSERAQSDFEASLRRSRGWNHARYLRSKGQALHEAGHVEAARGLWQRVVDQGLGLDVERAATLELLGDSYRRTDPERAEQCYRAVLDLVPSLEGTTATVEVSLAELLVDRGEQPHLDEAFALLESFLERGTAQYPGVLFRWYVARLRIAEANQDRDTVRRAARTALDLADRGPVFPRRKNLRAVDADTTTLRQLRDLAGLTG